MQFFLVSLIVFLNVFIALVLRYATNISETRVVMIALLLGVVLFISVVKFWLWGYIHKYFNLSTSYPMAATYYPIIYSVAIYYGETSFEVSKAIGTLLIFSGAILINKK